MTRRGGAGASAAGLQHTSPPCRGRCQRDVDRRTDLQALFRVPEKGSSERFTDGACLFVPNFTQARSCWLLSTEESTQPGWIIDRGGRSMARPMPVEQSVARTNCASLHLSSWGVHLQRGGFGLYHRHLCTASSEPVGVPADGAHPDRQEHPIDAVFTCFAGPLH